MIDTRKYEIIKFCYTKYSLLWDRCTVHVYN